MSAKCRHLREEVTFREQSKQRLDNPFAVCYIIVSGCLKANVRLHHRQLVPLKIEIKSNKKK